MGANLHFTEHCDENKGGSWSISKKKYNTQMEEQEIIIQKIKTWVQQQNEICYALAFGSILENRFHKNTNIDLAIVGTKKFSFDTILNWKVELESLCQRQVDLVDLKSVSGAILQEALVKGRELLLNDSSVKLQMLQKMIYDQADFQPMVKRMLKERRQKFYGQSNIIDNKLETIRRCAERSEKRMPKNLDEFECDLDAQDVAILNLERAVQQCVDLGLHILSERGSRAPEYMSDVFKSLESEKIISSELSKKMTKAVGFRNLAVHEYQVLDMKKVFEIAHSSLSDLKEFGLQILNAVKK